MFAVNLLSYMAELLAGDRLYMLSLRVFGEDWFKDEDRMHLYRKIIYDSKGSREVNRLRLFWSFQKLYLRDYNFYELVVPELRKMEFAVENAELGRQMRKELVYVLGGMLSQ